MLAFSNLINYFYFQTISSLKSVNMKGFTKVFFLVTVLLAFTSLFATVHRPEKVKSPPGYSVATGINADVLGLQSATIAFDNLNVQRCDAKVADGSGVTAEPVNLLIVSTPHPVPVANSWRTRDKESLDNYILNTTEKVTIPEAEALPDRSILD